MDLVPLYHWVEARKSQGFAIAVDMRGWDHSLGPGSGLGDKRARSLFLLLLGDHSTDLT